jgi:Family of unknown function (DUF6283)
MTECTKQRKGACSTCPWVKDGDRTQYFPPAFLKRSVVHAMERGNIHPCHGNNEFMCSGYLSFAEQRLSSGVDTLQMVRIGGRLGVFDYDMVNTDLNVFGSVKEMLADHEERARRFPKVEERFP